ncbi:lycopene cyclase family protein [Streptomyces sp. Amel2xB2]|uniref:lycopene cyclase family protein n=1 Tax=Streptomyces sp. Amel2xB2 TaxID=1305829 RepID=UPI000DB90DE0|nr:lycopene cyclase family protein [Streptomyces sp. Amel2xB2]
MSAERDADVVVVGAGAAGLSLAWRLAGAPRTANAAPAASTGAAPPSVVLVEPPPGPVRSPDRTWCFWEEGPGDFDDLVTASWRRFAVTGADGRTTFRDPGARTYGMTYKMLRSTDFTRELGARLDSSTGVRRVSGTVGTVRDVPGEVPGGEVGGVDARGRPFRLTGRWVFDSRPPLRLPPARTTLFQHFHGWFVRTGQPCFDPSVAQLMDFRTPQPRRGLAFVYLLPLAADRALVEYTVFSSAPLPARAYEAALRRYAGETRALAGGFSVTGTEHGVIPMTDGVFPRRAGASVFRIGAAAGAVRPSTGYAFTAIQRQAAAAAADCRAGRTPLPPRAHAWRHRTMDAVLLRALAAGRVDGAAFLTGLFRQHPADRVLRFLEGRSTPAAEWAIGLGTPVLPMARTLAELPFVRRVSTQMPRTADAGDRSAAPHGDPPRGDAPPTAAEHGGAPA